MIENNLNITYTSLEINSVNILDTFLENYIYFQKIKQFFSVYKDGSSKTIKL